MIPVPTGVRPRLLFVDDESRILLSLKAIFRADYDVTTAEGGPAALEALKKERFDVIVSDQRMPGITGVEVLRAARDAQPQAIRMLLTGYSDLNAIIASINEGEIFRFIPKPWVNGELRETIASAVRTGLCHGTMMHCVPSFTCRVLAAMYVSSCSGSFDME